MNYHEPLYRPPAEANSLILQITLGCSYNKCSFCSMYETKKFEIKSIEKIIKEIDEFSIYKDVRRVFLADGDALSCDTNFLVQILQYLKKSFPKLQRVASYASPYNLLEKSQEELNLLRENGLSLVYYGIESGNHELLKYINKPMKPSKMVEGINKAYYANMKISATVILGLGGKKLSIQHIEDTAKLVSECEHINYLSTLQLAVSSTKEDDFFKRFENKNQEFVFCSDKDILEEQKRFISLLTLKSPIIFRSNHASNALALKGTLPKDKDELLETLDKAIEDESMLRPKFLRGF
ncbi:radical SAM protein [Arcobacter sp.]|uniref:radical SAM protein n=1 Tax=unclassified Arcobacter TaxID=2593671 RepID=UPI003AFF8E77|eukprot:TRINITY_DN7281_c1_g1_i1.p1 TRINITY_DN7281_c1_g1~~TRINITY_DN7281_c1_g1_i1.p1  ORF type:complete len:295 (+),score=-66.41 TRINITY_DN7281_c1_g1_i1:467-1351(+)